MYDIIIIGAGVTGCAVARYLSRYEGRMLVLEKAEDVCCGTSKANSAIVHAGFDAAHGSLMAKMNLEGNLMMPQLAKDLDFAFKMNGSLVVCMSEEDLPKLRALYENGVKNGVKELEIVDAKRLHELEPNVSKHAVAALWAPTGGIVCPFNLTIALAENAFDNGVEFQFNTEVTGFTWEDGFWTIHTNHGDFEPRVRDQRGGRLRGRAAQHGQRRASCTSRRGAAITACWTRIPAISSRIPSSSCPASSARACWSARRSTATPLSARRPSTSTTVRARTPPPRV